MGANPAKVSYEPITSTLRCKHEGKSANVIQKATRHYSQRRSAQRASNASRSQETLADTEDLVIERLNETSTSDKTATPPSTASPPSYDSVTKHDTDKYEKDKTEQEVAGKDGKEDEE